MKANRQTGRQVCTYVGVYLLRPNKVNMFLVLLPGQTLKHFLLIIQIILWIALHKFYNG